MRGKKPGLCKDRLRSCVEMAKKNSNLKFCCICRLKTCDASINPHGPSSLEVTCEMCTNNRKKKFADRNAAFLRLPFDNKHADVTSKGDAIIVVNGKTDEPLYVHTFILACTIRKILFKVLEDRNQSEVVFYNDLAHLSSPDFCSWENAQSNKSPVFSKMFNFKRLKDHTPIVRIDDTTLPIIRSVIKFCYDADINFSDEVTGEDVLAVAHEYDIALLREVCEDHLIATINNGNLPKRLKFARKFELTGLEAEAIKQLKTNYDSLIPAVLAEFS